MALFAFFFLLFLEAAMVALVPETPYHQRASVSVVVVVVCQSRRCGSRAVANISKMTASAELNVIERHEEAIIAAAWRSSWGRGRGRRRRWSVGQPKPTPWPHTMTLTCR